MSIFRRTGIRTPTMPRVRPETEANKIQNPELIRSIQQGLGLKQMHTAPTLGSEVLPVVVVRDFTQTPAALPVTFCCFVAVNGSGGAQIAWDLWNPPAHSRIVKVTKLSVSPPHGQIINIATSVATTVPGTIKRGACISDGNLGSDFASRKNTMVGLFGFEGSVLGLGTWYEQKIQDGITAPPPEGVVPWVYEPRDLYLGPGGILVIFTDDTPAAQMLLSAEWQEFPMVNQ